MANSCLSFLPHCSQIATTLVALTTATTLLYSQLYFTSFLVIFLPPLVLLMPQHPLMNLKPVLAQITMIKAKLIKTQLK